MNRNRRNALIAGSLLLLAANLAALGGVEMCIRDRHLRVAAAEFGQVGEEAVQAHQSSASGGSSCAQRGQRQARRRSSAGIRSSTAASISVVKHQQAWVALAG